MKCKIPVLAVVLGASLVAAPLAQAREDHDWHGGRGWHGANPGWHAGNPGWHGDWHHHGGGGNAAAAAILGGLVGLGLGAAVGGSPAYAPPPEYYGGYPPGYDGY